METFYSRAIEDIVVDYVLISRGLEFNFWNTLDGGWMGSEKLPTKFSYNPDNFQSKNCQLSETEIGVGDSKGNIFVCDIVNSKAKTRTFSHHQEQIRVLCSSYELNPKMEVFLSGSEDDTILLWSKKLGRKMISFEDHTNCITDLCFARHDCSQFASASKDGTVKIFDLKGSCVMTFSDQTGNTLSCTIDDSSQAAVSPILFSSSSNNTVRLYNLNRRRKMNEIKGYDDNVTSLRCFPSQSKLIAADVSGTLYCSDWRKIKDFLWKIEDKNMIKVSRIIQNKANQKKFVICKDRFLQIHDLETGVMKMQILEKESLFGIFSFRNKEFVSSRIGTELNLTRNYVRLREEFVTSDNNEIFEEVNKDRGKEVKDALAMAIKSQVLKVKDIGTKRSRKIFSVYSKIKMVKRELQSLAKEFEEGRVYWMDLLDFLPHCMQKTQIDVQRINEYRKLLIKQNEVIQGDKMTKSQFKNDFYKVLETTKSNIEKIKKGLKSHWNEFHQLRNIIWKTMKVLKCSSDVINNFRKSKKLVYIGSVKQGKADGLGVIYTVKGGYTKIYEGYFKDNDKHGYGVKFSEDGEGQILWEGNMKNGFYDGECHKYSIKTGECLSAIYESKKVKVSRNYKFEIFPFRKYEKYMVPQNLVESRCESNDSLVYKLPKKLSLSLLNLDYFEKDEELEVKKIYRSYIRSWAYIPPHDNVMSVSGCFFGDSKMGCVFDKEVTYDGEKLLHENKNGSIQGKISLILQIAKGLRHLHANGSHFFGLNWKNVLVHDTKYSTKSSHSTNIRDSFSGNILEGVFGDQLDHLKVYLVNFCNSRGWFRSDFNQFHKFNPVYMFPSKPENSENSDTSGPSNSIKNYISSDIYSLGIMFYSLIFETFHPFSKIKICRTCNKSISSISNFDVLMNHIKKCGLRPPLEPLEISKFLPSSVYDWILILMQSMWNENPIKQPSLDEIVDTLTHFKTVKLVDVFNISEKEKKICTIVLREKKIKVLKSYIENNTHSKVLRIFEKKESDDVFLKKTGKESEEIEGEEDEEVDKELKISKLVENLVEIKKTIELIAYFGKENLGVPGIFVELEKKKKVVANKTRGAEFTENIKQSKIELVKQIEELEEEIKQSNRKFKLETKKLKKNEEDLLLSKRKLESENRKLKGSNQAFSNSQQTVGKKISSLEKENENLKSENEKNEEELKQFKKENEELKKKVKRLQNYNKNKNDSSDESDSEDSEAEEKEKEDEKKSEKYDSDEIHESDEDLINLEGKKELASGIWDSHAGEHVENKDEKKTTKKKEEKKEEKLLLGSARKPKIRGRGNTRSRGRSRGRGRRPPPLPSKRT